MILKIWAIDPHYYEKAMNICFIFVSFFSFCIFHVFFLNDNISSLGKMTPHLTILFDSIAFDTDIKCEFILTFYNYN